MRASTCAVPSPRPAAIRYHSVSRSVESTWAATELKAAMLYAYNAAPHGAKRARPQLVQMAKDVSRDQNRAPWTMIDMLFGAQDCGVSMDVLRQIPQALDAMIVARGPVETDLSLAELQWMECEIESLMNPIQWAIANGDTSMPMRKRLLEYVNRSIAILERIRKRLLADIYPPGAK